jgi:hypothetical protein
MLRIDDMLTESVALWHSERRFSPHDWAGQMLAAVIEIRNLQVDLAAARGDVERLRAALRDVLTDWDAYRIDSTEDMRRRYDAARAALEPRT